VGYEAMGIELRGVEYHTSIVNDFLSLDVRMAKP
jgi:hypothetical protein